jgi:glycosyltransferase involved in cell wall biosynthesis
VKILILTEAFYPLLRGGEMVLWHIARKLIERGHQVDVVTVRLPETPEHEEVEGVRIHRPVEREEVSKSESGSALLKKGRTIWELFDYADAHVREDRPDVVYTLAYTATAPGLLLGLRHGLPVLTDIGNFQATRHWRVSGPAFGTFHILKELSTLLLPGQSGFRSPSKFVASKIEQWSPLPVYAIPNPVNSSEVEEARREVDPKAVREEMGIDPDDRFFLFVGALEKVKNVSGLFEGFAKLGQEYNLVVVGSGSREAQLKLLADELFDTDRVQFLGQQPHPRVLRLMAASDGLVLASESENFPNVVIEALSAGTQVVSADVGGVSEVDSPNLHVVDDMSELLEAIQGLGEPVEDDSVLEKYSIENITDSFERMFRDVQ